METWHCRQHSLSRQITNLMECKKLMILMKKRLIVPIILVITLLYPNVTQALDIDTLLKYGELYLIHRNAEAGWRIEGNFTAEFDIGFFICDAENLDLWVSNQEAEIHEHQETTRAHSFNFTITQEADWYVVFSNTQAFNASSFTAEVYYIDQTDTIRTQVFTSTQSLISTPIIIAFFAVGITICLVGLCIVRRRTGFPAVRYDEILPRPMNS